MREKESARSGGRSRKWGVRGFLPRLGEEGVSRKPSGTEGSPARWRGSASRPAGGAGASAACGSLLPAVALAFRAPAAAASDRDWETLFLPGGADYQQLLLLSPARISLPEPTASHWAPSPPAPPSPSLPFPASPASFAAARPVDAAAQTRAQVPSSGML